VAVSLSNIFIYPLRTYLFFAALFLAVSCKKEEVTIKCTSVSSGTNADLTSIKQIADTIYITGNGVNYGVLLYSIDNGNSWNIINKQFDTGLNSICTLNNKLFAAGDSFKLYKSADNGLTWENVWMQGVISMEYITTIRRVISIGKKLYMCGGDELGLGFIGVSNDEGYHWDFTQVDHEMRDIVFYDDFRGVCCGYGALCYTNDGGLNWQFADAKSQFWTSLNLIGETILACSYSGSLMKSINMGSSWQVIRKSGNILNNNLQLICMDALHPPDLMAVGINGKGVFSDDNGNNWKTIQFGEKSHIYSILLNGVTGGIVTGENGAIYKIEY
jgi:photosystem II stability/assembly factor-like uncharacterized protein